MKRQRFLGCAVGLAVLLVLVCPGCTKTSVEIHATVDTQRASLDNMLQRAGSGGLSVEIDIAVAAQKRLLIQLDSVSQSAQALRHEADQLANAWEEAVRTEAETAAEESAEQDENDEDGHPSG